MPDDVKALAAAMDVDVPREQLLARLLEGLLGVLDEFANGGFFAVRDRWLARCAHLDAPVQILSEFSPPLSGRCVGVDVDGALMIETSVCVRRVLSGDVSLRKA
jgi:BirA family biotin operon repressor/biotin-[acetyl-CoA-carboxylase] ligase